MNVLICSQHGEIQVEEVSRKLEEKGINVVLFERYRKDQFITYRYSGNNASAIVNNNNKEYLLNSHTFPVVWYRPKPIILSEFPGELGHVEERFCMQEWKAILLSLESFLSRSKWINPILSGQKASNKAYQLKVANNLGLKTPETIITNDGNETLKLFQDGRVIYKTLSSFYSARNAIYTNLISCEQVKKSYQEISMAPGIFQKYIEKHYELRITVVGKKLFIAKINSQSCDESSIDWRRRPDPTMYELGTISKETAAKILKFHQYFNLVYAAYDFIVDLQGNEIFLECNPSGQWLWLEDVLGLDVSSAMVEELTTNALSIKEHK